MSRASEISEQIRASRGITPDDKVAYSATSAAVIQFFIIMGDRVKTAVRNYLSVMESELSARQAQLYLQLTKTDTASQAITAAISQLDALCVPIENFLAQFPIDTMIISAAGEGILSEPPEEVKQAASYVLSGIAGSNPIQIPSSVVLILQGLGIDAVSFCSGIETFKDLKDRIKVLGFKAARTASAANAAATGISYCTAKLEEYSIYKEILDLIS